MKPGGGLAQRLHSSRCEVHSLMTLLSSFRRHRSAILETWVERALASYPAPTAGRLKREQDPFLNPVGSTIRRELAAILDGVLDGVEPENVGASLDAIVRIRAVQDFDPSRALAFLFELKDVLRERAGRDAASGELLALFAAVDRIILLAFDQFVACREKIFEIRVGEIRNQTHRALQRAGIVGHDPVSPCQGAPGCDTERGPQS
jgi:hypothetical protein